MRKRRWSLEEVREASLDATADIAEWLYQCKPARAARCDDAEDGEYGRACGQPGYGYPANYYSGSLVYLEQVTRLSVAYATLPLRLLQGLYGGASCPPPRALRNRCPVALSVESLVVKLNAAAPSRKISFRVTNRGPQQFIDIHLSRLAARDGSIVQDVKVTLWDADGRQHALSDGSAKRIVSLEFGRHECQELALELSAPIGGGLHRARGALRLRPECGDAAELPIRLEID